MHSYRYNLVTDCFIIAGQYVIRFTVTSQRTTSDDITRDWAEIKSTATDILNESQDIMTTRKQRVKLAGTIITCLPVYFP